MKFIVPVKNESSRVPNKNFCNFYEGKSLTDILIEKILFVGKENIYISSDNSSKKEIADKYGCNFIKRNENLCNENCSSYSFKDVILGIVNQLPKDEEYAFCLVTDPLFNDYKGAISAWEKNKNSYDSLTTAYPVKKYLLNENYLPVNFGFGAWHQMSQKLPTFFELTYTFSIFKHETAFNFGYVFGSNPLWYHAKNEYVNIDTVEEFEIAKIIYREKNRLD